MSNLGVISKVNPQSLAINKRYKTNTVLPAEVRTAKINLMDDVYEAVMKLPREWKPPTSAEVVLAFVFPTRRNDLDGPIKHTLDALQDGLMKAHYDWNDRAIDHLDVTRYVQARLENDGLIMIFLREWEGA